MAKLLFDAPIYIGGTKITKHYIQSLTYEEREELVEPLFLLFRENGFIYPDDERKVKLEYKRLLEYEPDLSIDEVFNNSSLATRICKHYCHSFYKSTEPGKKTLIEVFNDDELLRRVIRNRLGMDWYYADGKGDGVNEAFNFSFKMMIQGMRSMRLVPSISMFKPSIAKYICCRYSKEGDLVGDYSAGFGGRMLGAVSCGRRYLGTDPLTAGELDIMGEALELSGYEVMGVGSECFRGDKGSVDLYWSSPPYYNQEKYSDDLSQAYNRGEAWFYDEYWLRTLENVRYMLKAGGWFGLNVSNNPKMLSMASEVFGEPDEVIKLRTVRSHLNKTAGITKFEPIYMYKIK